MGPDMPRGNEVFDQWLDGLSTLAESGLSASQSITSFWYRQYEPPFLPTRSLDRGARHTRHIDTFQSALFRIQMVEDSLDQPDILARSRLLRKPPEEPEIGK